MDGEPSEGPLARIPIPAPALVAISIGIVGMLAMGVAMGPFYEWAHEAATGLGTTR